jgi:hypothetical protein
MAGRCLAAGFGTWFPTYPAVSCRISNSVAVTMPRPAGLLNSHENGGRIFHIRGGSYNRTVVHKLLPEWEDTAVNASDG